MTEARRSAQDAAAGPVLSIVVPALNEGPNLGPLMERLAASLGDTALRWEVIFVDDGSTDRTPETLRDLHEGDPRIGFVRLARNFGHQMAILAGLDAARGEAVVVMDADLQQPPELIPEMVKRWQEGARIVQAVRETTDKISPIKQMTSAAFYAVIRTLASVPIAPNAAEFFLVDRQVVDYLIQCRERSRFNRGLLSWLGFPREFVRYEAAARQAGKTKYNARRMTSLALDAIFSFSVTPLRIMGALGILSVVLTAIYGVYVLIAALFLGKAVRGWPSLVALIGWFGSVQLLSLWAIGEYIARIYEDTVARPPYIVEDAVVAGGQLPGTTAGAEPGRRGAAPDEDA